MAEKQLWLQWQDDMRAEGAKQERDRIVKLLDVCPGQDWHERTLYTCECNLEKVSRESVIALITGEEA